MVGERGWRSEVRVLIKCLDLFYRSRSNSRTRRRTQRDTCSARGVSVNSKQIEMKVCWVIKLNVVSLSLDTLPLVNGLVRLTGVMWLNLKPTDPLREDRAECFASFAQ